MEFTGRVWEHTETVPAGESRTIYPPRCGTANLSIYAEGEGVSATVLLSTSTREQLSDGTARFQLAKGIGTDGVVTNGYDMQPVDAPLSAIKVVAAGGPVVVEFVQ
jgi:hypothetical protein